MKDKSVGQKQDECHDHRRLGDTIRGPNLTLGSGKPLRGRGF